MASERLAPQGAHLQYIVSEGRGPQGAHLQYMVNEGWGQQGAHLQYMVSEGRGPQGAHLQYMVSEGQGPQRIHLQCMVSEGWGHQGAHCRTVLNYDRRLYLTVVEPLSSRTLQNALYYRLTAFVLNTLQDADEADWRSILFIDNALLNKIAMWLTKQQDKKTGAFHEMAPFYDYNMKVKYTYTPLEANANQRD